MTFSLTTAIHPQSRVPQPLNARHGQKTQRPSATHRLNVTAGEQKPIPVRVPVDNSPSRGQNTPAPPRIAAPQTEVHHPPETETSVALNDMSTLGQAVYRSKADQVEALLGKLSQEEINQPDANGFPPLAVAVRYGNDFIVKHLLSSPKTDTNKPNKDQRTPLILAARYGRLPIIQQLLKTAKVELNAKDKDGMTALDWCMRQHNQDGIKLLKAAGAESAVYNPKKS